MHEREEGNEEEKGTSNANTERRSNLRVIGYLLSVQASRLRPRLRTRQARLPLQAPRYHRSAEFQQERELNG